MSERRLAGTLGRAASRALACSAAAPLSHATDLKLAASSSADAPACGPHLGLQPRRHTAHLVRMMTRGEAARPLPPLRPLDGMGGEGGLESAAVRRSACLRCCAVAHTRARRGHACSPASTRACLAASSTARHMHTTPRASAPWPRAQDAGQHEDEEAWQAEEQRAAAQAELELCLSA